MQLHIFLTRVDKKSLEEVAEANSRSASDMARIFIRDGILHEKERLKLPEGTP